MKENYWIALVVVVLCISWAIFMYNLGELVCLYFEAKDPKLYEVMCKVK